VGAWWLVWAAWTARGLAGHGQHWFLYSNKDIFSFLMRTNFIETTISSHTRHTYIYIYIYIYIVNMLDLYHTMHAYGITWVDMSKDDANFQHRSPVFKTAKQEQNRIRSSKVTKNSSVVGERHICVFNLKQIISFCNEIIFFPPGYSPNQVSFLEVLMPESKTFPTPCPSMGCVRSFKNYIVSITKKKQIFETLNHITPKENQNNGSENPQTEPSV
jgi:hypothetical protein